MNDSKIVAVVLQFADRLDLNMGRTSADYGKFRKINGLASLKLVFVDDAAYSDFRAFLLRKSGAAPGQFKLPRKIIKAEWIKLLLGHELKSDRNTNR